MNASTYQSILSFLSQSRDIIRCRTKEEKILLTNLLPDFHISSI